MIGRPSEPHLAQPKQQQAQAVYQEHMRTCPHCRRGRKCPVGRYCEERAQKLS
ncbi:MAG: hypothetical protein ACREN7_00290 [Candidatus Dormibacteria bacterium]